MDLVRLAVGTITTWFLLEFTNPSVVYHWMRGQSDFKLVFLKTLVEILHTMCSLMGQSVLYNVSREF